MNLLIAENLQAAANAEYCGLAISWTRQAKQFTDDVVPDYIGINIDGKFFVDGNNPDKTNPIYGGWGITGIIPPFAAIGESPTPGKIFNVFIRSWAIERDAAGNKIIDPATGKYKVDLTKFADSATKSYPIPAGFACNVPPTTTRPHGKKP